MKANLPRKNKFRFTFVVIGLVFVLAGLCIVIISYDSEKVQQSFQKTEKTPKTQVSAPLILATPITKLRVGDEFMVFVTLHPGASSVAMLRLVLQFDPEAVQLKKSEPLSSFPTILDPESVSYGQSSIGLGVTDINRPVTTEQSVMRYTFRALRPRAETTIAFSPESALGIVGDVQKTEYIQKDSSVLKLEIE